jgi:hypothetical protein
MGRAQVMQGWEIALQSMTVATISQKSFIQ